MLKRVKIQGYKSLVDMEVQLQPLSVLFGPNAAGKSNFLDALQLLSRIAAGTNLRSVFGPPHRGKPLESFTFGPEGVQGLLTKEKVSFSIEVDVELSQSVVDTVNLIIKEVDGSEGLLISVQERYLRYYISITILPKKGILYISDEYLAPLNDQGDLIQGRMFFHWDGIYRRGEGLKPLRFNGQRDISFLSPYSLPSQFYPSPSYLYITAMYTELASWSFFYLEPREHMRISSPVREVHRIGEMGEDVSAFLNTLRYADETQFKAVESALHMVVPSITGIDVEVNNLGEIELTFMEGQTPVSSRTISDGTLRVLGLLTLSGVKEKPSLIGFEEPENGIHPRRLQLVASFLKSRALHNSQVIVTTHSPVLLDFIPHDNLFVCHKQKGKTIIEPFSNWEIPDIDKALDGEEEELMVSERVLRGDFDA